MKKLLTIAAAIAALTFTACGNKTQNTAENDSTCTEACCQKEGFCPKALLEAVEAGDANSFQAKLEEAKAFIEKLIADGKAEEASKYAEQLKQFLADNKEAIANFTNGNETVAALVDKVTTLPTDVTALATALGVGAKDAAENAANAAADAASEAAADVQQKANDAVEAGKQKASEAIDNAAADMKGKLGL